MSEEIVRQRLIHPEETDVNLAVLSFYRPADETGTIDALYRCEGWYKTHRTHLAQTRRAI